MKRLFVAGVMFEIAALIIGLTWITPWANRGGSALAAPVPVTSPAAVSPSAVAPAPASGPTIVPVSLNQWSVAPSTTSIPSGKVTFKVANAGTITHEFVVLKTETPSADVPITSFEGEKDRINEDTSGTNVGETGDLTSGASKSLSINLQPGHYVFLCNLPAHYGLGMHTDVTVTAAAAPALQASTGPTAVPVTLNQWSVTPSTTTIPSGKVTFNVANDGTITHEFVVLQTDTPSADIPIKSFEGEKDRINEDTSGTNVGETGDLKPGATKNLTLTLQPGHYVFLCNLPAHYGLGMHTDITVTG